MRLRSESARVSCNISKQAGKQLDRIFDQILFARGAGWQDPNFKRRATNRQKLRPVGRKPVGLVLSLLIQKTGPETWEEIIKTVQPTIHTEHIESDEPRPWLLSRFGGGFVPIPDPEAPKPIPKPRRLKGVRPTSEGFRAEIRLNGKRIQLGHFKSSGYAARAYDKAALEHFGRKAQLNYSEAKQEWFYKKAERMELEREKRSSLSTEERRALDQRYNV
jgi:hypothetical protein